MQPSRLAGVDSCVCVCAHFRLCGSPLFPRLDREPIVEIGVTAPRCNRNWQPIRRCHPPIPSTRRRRWQHALCGRCSVESSNGSGLWGRTGHAPLAIPALRYSTLAHAPPLFAATGNSSGFCWLARCFFSPASSSPRGTIPCVEKKVHRFIYSLFLTSQPIAYMHTLFPAAALQRYVHRQYQVNERHKGKRNINALKRVRASGCLPVSAPSTANAVAAGDVMHGSPNGPAAQSNALPIGKRQKAESCHKAQMPLDARPRSKKTWRQ